MRFELYRTQLFLNIVKDLYDLREVQVLSAKSSIYLPFFCSRKPFRKKTVFSLPFGFYQTSDHLRQHWQGGEWEEVRKYGVQNNVDVTLTTVGELDIDKGVCCAYNPVLILDDVDDPSEKYSSNLRSNLHKEWNKCVRHGVEVGFVKDENEFRQFYKVMATQYVREHRMVFQPYELFRRFMDNGMAQLVVARQGLRVVGGMLLLMDGGVLHYNWGARARVGNVSVGTLLIDFMVRHAKAQGYSFFDFGSTPISDSHLLDFKMRWGCINLPVFKYFTGDMPKLIDLNASYGLARRLYSLLPVRVATALMPRMVPWLVS